VCACLCVCVCVQRARRSVQLVWPPGLASATPECALPDTVATPGKRAKVSSTSENTCRSYLFTVLNSGLFFLSVTMPPAVFSSDEL